MCLRDGGDNGPGPGTYSSRQQALVLHSVSIINIMPCIIDVNVIIILGEKGDRQSPFIRELSGSHIGHMVAMAPLSVYTMNKKVQT